MYTNTSIETLLYDFIIENNIATEDEISLVTNINGYGEKSLEDIIWARTEYRDVPQIYSCEGDYYSFSDEILDYYGLSDWKEHAREVLDENFPEVEESTKDDFCSLYWQNGLSDEENIEAFEEYRKNRS